MTKKDKDQKVTAKRERSEYHSFFQLVPKKPPEKIVPTITGASSDEFSKAYKKLTGEDYSAPTLYTTPSGRGIKIDEEGHAGVTATGSRLIYSPGKKLTISVTTPQGGNKSSIDLYLLVREKDYVPKVKRALFFELEDHPVVARQPLSVIASNETRQEQKSRKKARKELTAVGKSAKQLVFDYFKACGVSISQSEIEKENWNLCHLLSYAIAMNAKTEHGETFNTQIRENLFSGTRAFNENMMRIENVLLEMIKKNDVAEISYMAIHSEFEESHILAALTLKISVKTLDGRTIDFDYPFDVADDRKLSTEASTIYYATMMSLVNSLEHVEVSDEHSHLSP